MNEKRWKSAIEGDFSLGTCKWFFCPLCNVYYAFLAAVKLKQHGFRASPLMPVSCHWRLKQSFKSITVEEKFFCRCIWTFPFTLGSPGSDVPAMAGSTAHPRASEKGARLSQRNTPFKTHLEAASNKSSWHCCLGDLPQRNSYFYFEVHYNSILLSLKNVMVQFLFYSLKIPFHCEGNAALFPFDEMSCTAKLESRKYPFHSFNLLVLNFMNFCLEKSSEKGCRA